jgi:hypothetical protein
MGTEEKNRLGGEDRWEEEEEKSIRYNIIYV